MAFIKHILFSAIVIGLIGTAPGYSADIPKLLPIEPLSKTPETLPKAPLPRRPGYNRRGKIDAVLDDQIIINDLIRYTNRNTLYFTDNETPATRHVLASGKWAEFLMDEATNIILKIKVINQ